MTSPQARALCELNTRFYADQAADFSATRQSTWPGWQHLLEVLPERSQLSVLDLACGNLRFERLLAAARPETAFRFFAVDSCDALLQNDLQTSYQHLDLCAVLSESNANPARSSAGDTLPLAAALDAPACDLAVCFGFMHHLPLAEWRLALLKSLLAKTKAGGPVALSFWQFAKDPRILAKAAPLPADAGGGPGDYLLGWQGQAALRYCHSFADSEIDALAAAVSEQAELLARFSADGKTHNLNHYLIFRKR
ncbi:MAG: class I SAM-dependent methyltransferase [Coriobacteriales bacterium]|jgi:SAM-dependent methyltransferase|nr:class I SAM-dependent methyltransferase [Coriobacteriales bacterium]